MERFWASWFPPVVVLLLFGFGGLSGSWTVADPAPSAPMSTPRPPNIQYRGLNRVGTVVAIIIGCIIVPAGLIALLYLLINHCVIMWKRSRQEKSTADDNDIKQWSDMSDSEDEKKEMSTFYMYVNSDADSNGNLNPTPSNI